MKFSERRKLEQWLKKVHALLRYLKKLCLTLFFPMFSFDPPENIRKPLGFLMFSGGSKGNVVKKRVNAYFCYYFRKAGESEIKSENGFFHRKSNWEVVINQNRW